MLYKQYRDFTDLEWKDVANLSTSLINDNVGVYSLASGDGSDWPEVTDTYIAFNGDSALGMNRETFSIPKRMRFWDDAEKRRFDELGYRIRATKTGSAPYGVFASKLVIELENHFPSVIGSVSMS